MADNGHSRGFSRGRIPSSRFETTHGTPTHPRGPDNPSHTYRRMSRTPARMTRGQRSRGYSPAQRLPPQNVATLDYDDLDKADNNRNRGGNGNKRSLENSSLAHVDRKRIVNERLFTHNEAAAFNKDHTSAFRQQANLAKRTQGFGSLDEGEIEEEDMFRPRKLRKVDNNAYGSDKDTAVEEKKHTDVIEQEHISRLAFYVPTQHELHIQSGTTKNGTSSATISLEQAKSDITNEEGANMQQQSVQSSSKDEVRHKILVAITSLCYDKLAAAVEQPQDMATALAEVAEMLPRLQSCEALEADQYSSLLTSLEMASILVNAMGYRENESHFKDLLKSLTGYGNVDLTLPTAVPGLEDHQVLLDQFEDIIHRFFRNFNMSKARDDLRKMQSALFDTLLQIDQHFEAIMISVLRTRDLGRVTIHQKNSSGQKLSERLPELFKLADEMLNFEMQGFFDKTEQKFAVLKQFSTFGEVKYDAFVKQVSEQLHELWDIKKCDTFERRLFRTSRGLQPRNPTSRGRNRV